MTSTERIDGYPHDEVGEEADAPVAPTARQVDMMRRAEARMLSVGNALPPPSATRGAAGDLVAPAIVQLISEANEANPHRDKSSDGTWGDARHQALGSGTDHNAWLRWQGHGYVRAGDLDVDGLDLVAAVERARLAVLAGNLPQLADGGYAILNRRITSPDFTRWLVYKGADPHVTHGHFSASRQPAGFMSRNRWDLFVPAGAQLPTPNPSPAPGPTGWAPGRDATGRGVSLRAQFIPAPRSEGPRVAQVQAFMRRVFPAYAGHVDVDGYYGEETAGVIREFAARSAISGADGNNIGPKIATALWRAGFDR